MTLTDIDDMQHCIAFLHMAHTSNPDSSMITRALNGALLFEHCLDHLTSTLRALPIDQQINIQDRMIELQLNKRIH
jgi:hypothetical protein